MTRRQAFHSAKDRAGVPRSQQPVSQWQVGDDVSRAGSENYRYSRDPGTHGRYYQYETAHGSKVIVRHTGDPDLPPHMHAGQPKGKKGEPLRHDVDFKNERYQSVGGSHHIFYDIGS